MLLRDLAYTFFFNLFILFLAALGLHCYVRAHSNCDEQGLLSSCGVQASHCGGFALGAWALVVVAHGL